MLPEKLKLTYFTTARIIHKPEDTDDKHDWLWINARESARFKTIDGAQSVADLANANGQDNGLNIDEYPFFVAKVTQTSLVERVEA